MKYLVTGGAGFIGGAISRQLLANGHTVAVLDNLSTGYRERVPNGVELIEFDLSDPAAFASLKGDDYDAVLHLAAQSSGEISHDRPAYDLQTNALGTLLLLRWCESNRIKRFLYASSMAVYGDVSDQPVSEEQRCEPLSFYGITKLAAEHYIRHFSSRGMQTTIFRMFNVYGPGQNMANMKQGMVSIYLAYLLQGVPIVVKGRRDRFRDFTYIDDVVSAWVSSIGERTTFGRTYNLASGTRTRVDQLLEVLVSAFGLSKNHPIEYVDGTPGDQFGIYADVSRLIEDLSWQPEATLPYGVARMVEWARGRQ